uniref:(northern house mosquito) hypothetical protein n=1 Tax=Culex pipiens TaxID=7175 RepID=A0A8D8BJJ5_CULPI
MLYKVDTWAQQVPTMGRPRDSGDQVLDPGDDDEQQNIKHRDQLSPHSLKPGFNFSNFPRTRFFFLFPILCYSLFHSVSLWHFSTLTSAFVHCETISTSRNFSDRKRIVSKFRFAS